MPGGRPPKLTPEIQKGICDCIAQGNFRETAGLLFGISPRTMQRWMANGRKFPDGVYGGFCRAVIETEERAHADVVAKLYAAGTAGDLDTLWKWLERKYPELWGRDSYAFAMLKRELIALRKEVRRER